MNENNTSRLKTGATIVGAVAALGAWLLPGGIRSCRMETVASSSKEAQVQTAPETPDLSAPKESERVEPLAARRKIENGLADKSPDSSPQEFSLANGEQKILLSGRAGLSAEFTEVSGVGFVTLRVNVDDQSTPYALSHSGERIKFRCAASDYYLSVMSIDNTAEKVQLRVDRAP